LIDLFFFFLDKNCVFFKVFLQSYKSIWSNHADTFDGMRYTLIFGKA